MSFAVQKLSYSNDKDHRNRCKNPLTIIIALSEVAHLSDSIFLVIFEFSHEQTSIFIGIHAFATSELYKVTVSYGFKINGEAYAVFHRSLVFVSIGILHGDFVCGDVPGAGLSAVLTVNGNGAWDFFFL